VLTSNMLTQVVVLVGLESLARYLPEAEADNVDSWKATLYRRLNGVRMFDRPVPLLLVRQPFFVDCLDTPAQQMQQVMPS
jgi:hypothetical protein